MRRPGAGRPPQGLIDRWTFDDIHGISVPDAAGARTGINVGGRQTPGKVGPGALDFRGTQGYVDVSSFPTPLSFTASAWVYVENPGPGQQTILLKRGAGDIYQTRFQIAIVHGGYVQGRISTGATFFSVRSPSRLSAKAWHHIALSYDGDKSLVLYIDGLAAASARTAAHAVNAGDSWLRIGAGKGHLASGRVQSYFDGVIDDVRLYAGAVSADDIAVIYGEARQRRAHLPPRKQVLTGPRPVLSLSAMPGKRVPRGGISILSWHSHNVTGCIAQGAWRGKKTVFGSAPVSPQHRDSTYVLVCTGINGERVATGITMHVVSAPPATHPKSRLPANTWVHLDQSVEPPERCYSGAVVGGGYMFYWGGGHGCYSANDVALYDISKNTWTEASRPESWTDVLNWDYLSSPQVRKLITAYYGGWNTPYLSPSGAPLTRHTYQQETYDPDTGSFCVFYHKDAGIWCFSPRTMKWSRFSKTAPAGADIHTWNLTYDPDLHTLVIFVGNGGSGPGAYAFIRGRWRKIVTLQTTSHWSQVYSAYDPSHKVHVVFSSDMWQKVDLGKGQSTRITPNPSLTGSFSIAYNPPTKTILVLDTARGKNHLWSYDMPTDRWKEVSLSGPPPTGSMNYDVMGWDDKSKADVVLDAPEKANHEFVRGIDMFRYTGAPVHPSNAPGRQKAAAGLIAVSNRESGSKPVSSDPPSTHGAASRPVSTGSGLIDRWPFDEGKGIGTTDIVKRRMSTIAGGKWARGKAGNALDFSVRRGYVQSPVYPTPGSMTVSAWINDQHPSDGTTQVILLRRGTGDRFSTRFRLSITANGHLEGLILKGSSQYTVTSPAPLPAGTWHQVALSYNGGNTLALYLDGSRVAVTHTRPRAMSTGKGWLRIGAGKGKYANGSPVHYLVGMIDEVQMYNKTLSQEEISKLYKQPAVPALAVAAARPPVISLSISNAVLSPAQSARLNWTATASNACRAAGAWKGKRPTSGTENIHPAKLGHYTYALSCSGPAGDTTNLVRVVVRAPVADSTYSAGDRVTATAQLRIAKTPGNDAPPIATVAAGSRGTLTEDPRRAADRTWWYVQFDNGTEGWSAEDKLAPAALSPLPKPSISLNASKQSVPVGDNVKLSWQVRHADRCLGTGNLAGSLAVTGGETVTLDMAGPNFYGLMCTGPGGTTKKGLSVTGTVPTALSDIALSRRSVSTPVVPKSTFYLTFLHPRDPMVFNAYIRYTYSHVLSGKTTLELRLRDYNGYSIPCYQKPPFQYVPCYNNGHTPRGFVFPKAWVTVDGRRVSGELSGPVYDFTLDTRKFPDGMHVIGADVQPQSGARVINIPLPVTFDNGGPVSGTQPVAVCQTMFGFWWGLRGNSKHEITNNGRGCDWATYRPGRQRSPSPNRHPRKAVPYSTVPPPSKLWTERLTTPLPSYVGFVNRFVRIPEGGITADERQLYYYSDMTTLQNPQVDGPRNIAATGHIVSGYVDKKGNLIATFTEGRIARITPEGNVTTLIGVRLKPGRVIPYWNSKNLGRSQRAFFNNQYEIVGNFVNGPVGLIQPWDAIPDKRDPTGKTLFITDTYHHRIVKANLHTNPPTITTYAGSLDGKAGFKDGVGTQALFDEPWYLAMDDAGNLYVSDRANFAIRKIAPDRSVTTVVRSSVTPSGVDVSRNIQIKGRSVDQVRRKYLRNGRFGKATLMYPEGMRFDSHGNLIVAENLTRMIRRVNLKDHTITSIGSSPDAHKDQYSALNLDLDVDRNGACGPKDSIYIATFAETGPFRMSPDDGKWNYVIPPYISGGLADIKQGAPLDQLAPVQYPWLAVCGADGSLWIGGTGDGIYRITRASPGDPQVDRPRYNVGRRIYLDGTIKGFPLRSPFGFRHGPAGASQLTGKTFDDLASMSDAQLGHLIQSGWGSASGPRPEISGRDLNALLYYIRWNSLPSLNAGNLPRSFTSSDNTPPGIATITASKVTGTSVMIRWTTDEPAIGFIMYGNTSTRAIASKVEGGYGKRHAIILSDLNSHTAYSFTVRQKDLSGNQSTSSPRTFVTQ